MVAIRDKVGETLENGSASASNRTRNEPGQPPSDVGGNGAASNFSTIEPVGNDRDANWAKRFQSFRTDPSVGAIPLADDPWKTGVWGVDSAGGAMNYDEMIYKKFDLAACSLPPEQIQGVKDYSRLLLDELIIVVDGRISPANEKKLEGFLEQNRHAKTLLQPDPLTVKQLRLRVYKGPRVVGEGDGAKFYVDGFTSGSKPSIEVRPVVRQGVKGDHQYTIDGKNFCAPVVRLSTSTAWRPNTGVVFITEGSNPNVPWKNGCSDLRWDGVIKVINLDGIDWQTNLTDYLGDMAYPIVGINDIVNRCSERH